MKLVLSFGLFALLLVSVASADVTIGPGNNFTFPYNGTGNETFMCAEPGLLPFNLTLTPGETRPFQTHYSVINATCSNPGNVTSAKTCIIDSSIAPGEVYQNQGGSCDVRVEARTIAKSGQPIEEYTHYEEIRYEIDEDGHVTIRAGNKTYGADLTDGTTSITQRVEFMCPQTFNPKDIVHDDEVLAMCEYMLPELSKSFVSVSRDCVDASLDSTRIIGDLSVNTTQILTQKGELQGNFGQCTANLAAQINRTSAAEKEANEWRMKYEDERDEKYQLWTLIAVLLSLVAALVYFFVLRGDQ